jgi:hypothetical protein
MATAELERQIDAEAEREGNAISFKNFMTPHGIPGKRLQSANFKTLANAEHFSKKDRIIIGKTHQGK